MSDTLMGENGLIVLPGQQKTLANSSLTRVCDFIKRPIQDSNLGPAD